MCFHFLGLKINQSLFVIQHFRVNSRISSLTFKWSSKVYFVETNIKLGIIVPYTLQRYCRPLHISIFSSSYKVIVLLYEHKKHFLFVYIIYIGSIYINNDNHPSLSTIVFKKKNNTPKVVAKLLWKCGIFRLINLSIFFFQSLETEKLSS